MTKRQSDSLLSYAPHYSSAGEKQFICFTAAACWQKRAIHLRYPWVWIAQNNRMQNRIHVFQTKRDKIVGFDILKGFKAANSLVQLVVRGCGR